MNSLRGRKRDPVAAFEKRLMADGILTEETRKQIAAGITQEIDEAVEFADQSPYPDPSELTDFVWA